MKSEFAALSDLAISHGISHSDLVAEIHTAVLEEFRSQNPKSPADAAVILDETSGKVRIYSGERDITPSRFGPAAERIARQVIIDRLARSKSSPVPPASSGVRITFDSVRPRLGGISSLLANLFFWGYNLYFALFSLFFLFSTLTGIRELFREAGIARVLFSLILFLTPPVSMFWALRRRLYQRPSSLLKLFFLFELPVVFVAFLPLAVFTNTTPFFLLLFFLTLSVPLIFYLLETNPDLSVKARKVLLFVQQAVFMLSVYIVTLFTFWIPPALAGLFSGIFGGLSFSNCRYPTYSGSIPNPTIMPCRPDYGEIFYALTIGAFVLLIVSALLLLPYLVTFVLGKAFFKTRRGLLSQLSRDQLALLHGVYAVIIISVVAVASYQPSVNRLLSRLREISTAGTFAAREQLAKELLPHENRLRTAIRNSNQYRFRYLFTKDDTSLSWAYQRELGLSESAADFIQSIFTGLAYPFVYQGVTSYDGSLAQNFQYVFGSSPYADPDDKPVEPAPAKNVHLSYRQVEVTPDESGLFAAVSIEEEYDNQTFSQQEVLYEFSLSPGSVMTDLKLGPDLEFPGIIAPKGAAQRVYEQQLVVRRDPALLEETGPHQYRLRVFPVPAKGDRATLAGRRQKVRYTYIAPATPDGYSLPRIYRMTNVFTNSATRLTKNVSGSVSSLSDRDAFVPLPSGTDICQSAPARLSLTAGGRTISLRSLGSDPALRSLTLACSSPVEASKAISGKRIAVFYDVSGGSNTPEFTAKINSLPDLISANTVDLYKFNDLVSDPVQLTKDNLDEALKVSRFGKSKGLSALTPMTNRYDLVLVLTDSQPPLPADFPFAPPAVIFLISPEPAPPYPMEFVSRLLQTGGSAVSSVDEALQRYAIKSAAAGGYILSPYFSVVAEPPVLADQDLVPVASGSGSLSYLLNHGLFRARLETISSDVTGNITLMDQLHRFAGTAHIVTPYSSLLSLVNDAQRRQLEREQQSYDRYEDRPLLEAQPTPGFNPVPLRRGGVFESLDMVGPSQRSLNLSPGFGGIANPVAPSADMLYANGGGGGGFSLFGAYGLFALANLVLLAVGMGFYLLRLIRRKS